MRLCPAPPFKSIGIYKLLVSLHEPFVISLGPIMLGTVLYMNAAGALNDDKVRAAVTQGAASVRPSGYGYDLSGFSLRRSPGRRVYVAECRRVRR